ncbi:MAG: inorganic phosphate transporter, partial [Rhodocyclaceae bacterium]|nr:inorganic phosphate transporter [Rhodocyclaceae bacterium]
MELKHLSEIERATQRGRNELARLGMALLFIVGVMLFASTRGQAPSMALVVAAMIGGYMAMNIGANDVANNVGPAVGSKALSLIGALIIAAIFEAAGALIAGGEVVDTIKSSIVDASQLPSGQTFVWLMMAALLAGALWLNIATAVGAPVSTTHSIVGAVLGAGMAAAGPSVANWGKVGSIAASWVISPILGGIIAAGFLYFIKRQITYQTDMAGAARRVVPYLVGIMAWAFGTYLMLKGVSHIVKIGFGAAIAYGLVTAIAVFLAVRPAIGRLASQIENSKQGVNRLFTVPLVFAAALLSFAHGSNDVANAVGPLAAIVDSLGSTDGALHAKAAIPLWVMLIGALG